MDYDIYVNGTKLPYVANQGIVEEIQQQQMEQ